MIENKGNFVFLTIVYLVFKFQIQSSLKTA